MLTHVCVVNLCTVSVCIVKESLKDFPETLKLT